MKKIMAVLLAMVLALCSFSFALADDPDEIPGTVEIPYAGLTFVPPEAYRNAVGQIVYNGYDQLGASSYYAAWYYCAMTEDELNAIYAGEKAIDETTPITVLFYSFTLGNGIDLDNLIELTGFDKQYFHEIGKAGDYSFYFYMEPIQEFIDAINSVYRDEYMSLINQPDLAVAAFTCYEPLDRYASMIGSKLEFTTTDLDGNTVSSADLFAQNEITMVNIWATWCGPCVGELAKLQQIHTRLQEKKCGIVGLLDDTDLDSARQLVADNGVEYPVILAPDNFYTLFPIEVYPTSFFINQEGQIIADPLIGAYVDLYEPTIESLLDVQ